MLLASEYRRVWCRAGRSLLSGQTHDFEEQAVIELDAPELNFGYRHSILKENPDRFLVLTVTLKLSAVPNPRVGYGALREELEKQGLSSKTHVISRRL